MTHLVKSLSAFVVILLVALGGSIASAQEPVQRYVYLDCAFAYYEETDGNKAKFTKQVYAVTPVTLSPSGVNLPRRSRSSPVLRDELTRQVVRQLAQKRPARSRGSFYSKRCNLKLRTDARGNTLEFMKGQRRARLSLYAKREADVVNFVEFQIDWPALVRADRVSAKPLGL